MYAGKIVEYGSVEDIFYRPQHPYTRGMLDSIPHFESGHRLEKLKTIPGMVPSLMNLPEGCRFSDRCSRAQAQCKKEPSLQQVAGAKNFHQVSCFFPLGSPQ
jgi:oligopeptide/dipeptide ABC transporter ATP-binding protein